jgi:hypothetical protein
MWVKRMYSKTQEEKSRQRPLVVLFPLSTPLDVLQLGMNVDVCIYCPKRGRPAHACSKFSRLLPIHSISRNSVSGLYGNIVPNVIGSFSRPLRLRHSPNTSWRQLRYGWTFLDVPSPSCTMYSTTIPSRMSSLASSNRLALSPSSDSPLKHTSKALQSLKVATLWILA